MRQEEIKMLKRYSSEVPKCHNWAYFCQKTDVENAQMRRNAQKSHACIFGHMSAARKKCINFRALWHLCANLGKN